MSRTKNSKKQTNKPPSWFKRMRRQEERAQAKQALREERDPTTRPHSDQWDWT